MGLLDTGDMKIGIVVTGDGGGVSHEAQMWE